MRVGNEGAALLESTIRQSFCQRHFGPACPKVQLVPQQPCLAGHHAVGDSPHLQQLFVPSLLVGGPVEGHADAELVR
ncbi:hypothetical protein MSMEI_4212 [Mycolicibacterium smegmatis MC2 155]|uniref:Uncharacterized protein n=1 Tax=Mycolicibacterium smegmatis (strain ATCC 700084 / mc(2)155) TaxID=246196 RepID=I7GD88_MYCS2|nr:hypothetical protein MSMEI_4212 [Mycolicibacterium smegmatis MC2 155]